jgi:hypothetical protein
MKENFDRFKFALYKEKEMPEFRKWIIALAALALFAGLASAQVGPVGGNTGQFQCSTNTAVNPTLRNEGYTEVVGDIVLTCSGGIPQATNPAAPALIPTANFTIGFSTQVTSRLLSTTAIGAGFASEALLLVDEPGANLTESGYGPTVPQTPCLTAAGASAAQFGASPGGCPEWVGATAIPGGTAGGVPVSGVASPTVCTTLNPCAPGANVFQGVVTGNQVTFFGIPVLAPATSGNRVFRITNIRINASAIPNQAVTASLSISSSTSVLLSNPLLVVGVTAGGLSQTNTTLRNASNTGAGGATFNQCNSSSVTSTGSTAAVGLLQYQEGFGTAFKIRQNALLQNVPGTIYNSESNFVTGSAFGSVNAYSPGQADYATRLKATFNNVPAGVSIFVSTRDVVNSFNAGFNPAGNPAGPSAVLVVGETTTDNLTSDIGLAGATPPPGITLATSTGNYTGPSGAAIPIAPVTLTGGTGLAVWEVVYTNPATIDTLEFSVFVSYSPSVATNSPAPGTMTVTMSFAPTPSGGAFTAAQGQVAQSAFTIPRFSDSLDIGPLKLASIQLCTTALLFPYVVNAGGFDTGISIANTTIDNLASGGTSSVSAQNGVCTLNFYSAGTAVPPFTTPTPINAGTLFVTTASTVSPGFQGYMIANCNFQDAHGFAFVSDVGVRNFAMGYLPLILLRSGTGQEALNN